MAGETVKSVTITALDAGYPSLLEATQVYGSVKSTVGLYSATAATVLEVTDIIKMIRVPSNATILSLLMFNDDLDSNGVPTLAFDLGIYATDKFTIGSTTYAAGAVIDVDAYATAVTNLQSANVTGGQLMCEARDIIKIGSNRIWEDAGLTSDPQTYFDIALTITTAPATFAAGDIKLVALFAAK